MENIFLFVLLFMQYFLCRLKRVYFKIMGKVEIEKIQYLSLCGHTNVHLCNI